MSHLPGKFVWFEQASNDTAQARSFYESLLGWHTESMPMGERRYSMILNRGQGIGGFVGADQGAPSRWMSYLSVPDVDAAHAAVVAAGGRSISAPVDFGRIGRGAEVADPTGARFWVWRNAQGDRADEPTAAAGDWCWNELMTTDDSEAVGFFEKVFGYQRETIDMGEQRLYHLLKKDGVPRAGVMKFAEPDNPPPAWLPYVAVDDCDAIAAKARTLGGQVVSAPMDIPNVGRMAVLIDPTGAAIAIMHMLPMED